MARGDFSEAFGISPNDRFICGTFGQPMSPPPPAILGYNFHGFRRAYDPIINMATYENYDHDSANEGLNVRSAVGVNDGGDIVGLYRDEARGREIHGYIWRYQADAPKPFDLDLPQNFPDANQDGEHSAAFGINNQDLVVGVFQARGLPSFWVDRGYVARASDPSSFVGVDMNDGLAQLNIDQPNVTATVVRAINSHGDIVGNFTRFNPRLLRMETHGFKWKVDLNLNLIGDPTIIDARFVPSSGTVASPALPTLLTGINDSGNLVGYYLTFEGTTAHEHGFFWAPNNMGTYEDRNRVPIDMLTSRGVAPQAISNNNIIVGYYKLSGRHAFAGRFLPGGA